MHLQCRAHQRRCAAQLMRSAGGIVPRGHMLKKEVCLTGRARGCVPRTHSTYGSVPHTVGNANVTPGALWFRIIAGPAAASRKNDASTERMPPDI